MILTPAMSRGAADPLSAKKRVVQRNGDKMYLDDGRQIDKAWDDGYKEGRSEADDAYHQRNCVVAVLAKIFPSGVCKTSIPGWDDEWHGCVYIELPTGQISYHFHDSEAHLFAGLPKFIGEYDGHDKEAVHARLAAVNGCFMFIPAAKSSGTP